MQNRIKDSSSARTLDELEENGYFSLRSCSNNGLRQQQQAESKMFAATRASIIRYDDSPSDMLRDRYFAYVDQERANDYYQALKSKLENNEKLLAEEYYYFAMTTDDISQLNLTALQHLSESHHIQKCDANIDVMIAALSWQKATDSAEKKAANDSLRQALKARGNIRNGRCEMFLNLSGIDLSGADLSLVNFDYTDLSHANLTYANLYETGFHYSRLDHADLSHANCVRPDLEGRIEGGPQIRSSFARNACFENIVARNLDWRETDFWKSSFKHSDIGYGIFDKTNFDECNFSDGSIHFFSSQPIRECSMKLANLINCKLINVDYAKVDLTGAKFMPITAFSDGESLSAALDILNQEMMEKIRTEDTSPWHRTSQINNLQMIIAESILIHLDKLSMLPQQKSGIIETVLDHNLFLPEKYFDQLAFRAERNIYAFFSSQTHESYASDAVKLLEATRDALLQEDIEMRMN